MVFVVLFLLEVSGSGWSFAFGGLVALTGLKKIRKPI